MIQVLREALLMTLIALLIGWAGSLLVARALRTLLFSVTSTDPATLVLVSAAVLAVAALASFLPTWRATRVDPMAALRHE